MSFQFIVGQLFTFLLAPVALFMALTRLLPEYRNARALVLLAAFAFAPALISRLLIWLFELFPGHGDQFYAAWIVAAFALLALFGRGALSSLGSVRAEIALWFRANAVTITAAAGLAAALLALLFSAAGRGWVITTLFSSIGNWNLNGTGISGIMPPVALAILLPFLAALFVRAGAPSRPSPLTRLLAQGTNAVLAGLLMTCVAAAAVSLFGQPVYENDAMQYFKVASLLHGAHSTSGYPVLPAAPDGTYASSSHPLGHYGVLIWGYITAGKSAPFPGKLWSLYSFAVTLGAIGLVLRRFSAPVVLSAMLILLTTPAYLMQVIGAGIDPQRLMLLFVATITLVAAAQTGRPLLLLLAGAGAGLALQSHVQSLLLAPIAIGLAALLMPRPLPTRLLAGAGALAVAAVVGGEQYLFNIQRFGSPFYNDQVIWAEVPSLKYRDWRMGKAPRTDFIGRLGSGAFLGFSWWYFFGLGWWLAVLAMLGRARSIVSDAQLRGQAALVCAALFTLVLFFGVTASGEVLVMNYRYAMAVQPFVAVLGGLAVGGLLVPASGWLVMPRALCALVVLGFSALHSLAVQAPQLPYARATTIGGTQYDALDAMPIHAELGHLGELDVVKEVRARTPKDAVFVVFNMNSFAYYADRRFVRDVDPRMIPFYRSADTASAAAALRALGVGYVYLQPWSWPTVDNSLIKSLVADPAYATLVFEKHGYRIFRLTAAQ